MSVLSKVAATKDMKVAAWIVGLRPAVIIILPLLRRFLGAAP